MNKKPRTTPVEPVRGGAPSHPLPTLRPLGPVLADRDTDWMPLKDAQQMLSQTMPSAHAAADWLLKHITSGELPITCRLLTYRKHGVGMAICERHEWPGREARLAEQIERASSQPLSGIRALPGTANLEWLDVTGDYAVDARMSFPHVDREALASFFPELRDTAALGAVAENVSPEQDNRLGQLPSNATAADLRDEPFAHEAARRVRAGMKLSDALREVAPDDPTREPNSVQHGIRRTYRKMYDGRGLPIRI